MVVLPADTAVILPLLTVAMLLLLDDQTRVVLGVM